MSKPNYASQISNMTCAVSAMKLMIEKLWDDQRTPEAFILEKLAETIDEGVLALDELVTASGGYQAK